MRKSRSKSILPRSRVAGAIEIIDNAIPNSAQVLDEIMSAADWTGSKVGLGPGNHNPEIRDNDVHWIYPFDFRTPTALYLFTKRVWEFIDEYGQRYDRSFSNLEAVNINRYLPGQQYHVHADAGGQSTRVISALVYLNDDFAGGETEFVHFGKKITPETGRLVIFPSDYAYAHAALPPRDGVKYSAAFWVNA